MEHKPLIESRLKEQITQRWKFSEHLLLPVQVTRPPPPFLFCVGLHAIAFNLVSTVKMWGVHIIFSHHFMFSCMLKETSSFFGWLEERFYSVKLKKTTTKKRHPTFFSELDQGEKIMTEF